jgi:L-ascorbate metabolism protein UlaG (beta-lactamase superfamily)
MATSPSSGYLRAELAVVPLIDRWYAWSHLLSPATYALNIVRRYIPMLASFIEAPDLHAEAVRDKALLGGPFVNLPPSAVDDAQLLLQNLREKYRTHSLAKAIESLFAGLERFPQADVAADIPVPPLLDGIVEVTLDVLHRPQIRFRDALMAASGFLDETRQSVFLVPIAPDHRPFIFSTPFLDLSAGIEIELDFGDPRLDACFRAFDRPTNPIELAGQLGLIGEQARQLEGCFVTEAPRRVYQPPTEGTVRWRHFGHGCVLVEGAGTAILLDPLISHGSGDADRLTYHDLPERIDAVLITHNHQDHVSFESLLRLRHRIGRVVVPRSANGLEDPSLAGIVRRLGFSDVTTLEELEEVHCGAARITAFPFLGEHGDLSVQTKLTYKVSIEGVNLFFAADTNVGKPAVYGLCRELIGEIDTLFLGMECEGAPMSWVYGPLLARPLARKHDGARRLSGSDFAAARRFVEILRPRAAYVYAMGEEPWVTHISAKKYTTQSRPMVESQRLVEHCRAIGVTAERLTGCPSETIRTRSGACD